MSFPKPERFPLSDQVVSRYGRALSHPARSFILRMLEERGEMYFYEIVQRVPLTEGPVTEHLRRLRVAGLVDVREEGLMNAYSLNVKGLEVMRQVQEGYLGVLLAGAKDGQSAAHG